MRKRMALSVFLMVSMTVISSAQSPFEIDGIRFGLKRSPDDFVAGVFRSYGQIHCENWINEEQLCWASALVLDEFASRPGSKAPRTVVKVLTMGEPGQQPSGRFIGFLIPIEATDVYSGAFLTHYGPKKHQRFRNLVEMAISGTRSL